MHNKIETGQQEINSLSRYIFSLIMTKLQMISTFIITLNHPEAEILPPNYGSFTEVKETNLIT